MHWWWKTCQTHFSIYFACLQIFLFKAVILCSFWAIPPNKMGRWNIFLIKVLSMLTSPQIKMVKPPDKKPGISDRLSFLHRRSVKFQFVWQKLCYNVPLAGLLQNDVGLCDSSSEYQKSFMCWRKMCLMVVLCSVCLIYRNGNLSVTCQCQQLKLNLLSMQINIYCLMTNQTPALLVQHALWMGAAVTFSQSLYFSRPPPPTAIIPSPAPSVHLKFKMAAINRRGTIYWWSHEKTGDCEQSSPQWEHQYHHLWYVTSLSIHDSICSLMIALRRVLWVSLVNSSCSDKLF